jgi:hypothetical protein
MTGTVPPGRCPAQHGDGADIRNAYFLLVVEDCCTGPDGRPARTEIFGFFRRDGDDHDDDALPTGCLEVPAASPVAVLARRVGTGWDGRRIRRVARTLRRNVERCPCAGSLECPALDEVRLFEAIEHAAGGWAERARRWSPRKARRADASH